MPAAPITAERVRAARAVEIVGGDSPELLGHGTACGCASAQREVACVAAPVQEPSGDGTVEAAPAVDTSGAKRLAWSRQAWSSTAAFTIGKPPRAPRAGD